LGRELSGEPDERVELHRGLQVGDMMDGLHPRNALHPLALLWRRVELSSGDL
jgi:hypothetical protein